MMEKETNNVQLENPSLLSNNNKGTKELESPRKPFVTGFVIGGSSSGGGDRLKRDEWSEGAVSSLLEAYESKWVLRNRAKLKGYDWEEVAKHVSSRTNGTKSPKTQTQCKNKIESMKKRYRSESVSIDASSSWPLYSRLDLLLRGNGPPSAVSTPQLLSQVQSISASTSTTPTIVQAQAVIPVPDISLPSTHSQLVFMEPSPMVATQVVPPPPLSGPQAPKTAQNSHGSNGVDRVTKVHNVIYQDEGAGNKLSDNASDKNQMETDSSTPALYSEKGKLRSKRMKLMKMEKRKRKRKEDQLDIAESIRWLAEVVVKSEQARMETMREIEKMRVEAEAKRDEMDFKRTEIIANTQLEIARLFATGSSAKSTVDSSLRIGRN